MARCQGCGSFVTSDFARVFGDQDNVVHRCLDCDSFRRLNQGSGAGQPVSDTIHEEAAADGGDAA
ncbi:hypothetical protein ACFQH6_19580 [Halobacteriaceae archaeon GCM10025711]